MPGGAVINNPTGAFGYTDLNQTIVPDEKEVMASGMITAGDVVVWDVQNTNDVPTLHSADVSADDAALIAGVALESVVSGDSVKVCRDGPCLVNIGNASVTEGQSAGFHATTDGAADNETSGTASFGTFLGGEIGTTNQAVVDVRLAPPGSTSGSVATGDIADNAVTNPKLADDAVDSAEIADGAIDLVHMSINSVDSDQYVDGSIDTAHYADDSVTGAKIASGFLDIYVVAGNDETMDATYTVTGVAVGDQVQGVIHNTAGTLVQLVPGDYTVTGANEITSGNAVDYSSDQLLFFVLDQT